MHCKTGSILKDAFFEIFFAIKFCRFDTLVLDTGQYRLPEPKLLHRIFVFGLCLKSQYR